MPDDLMARLRREMAGRNVTFRDLVIDALEQALRRPTEDFVLRDATAGRTLSTGEPPVSSRQINDAIDEQRQGR